MKVNFLFSKVWLIIWKKIIAVIDETFAVAKRKPENIQACTGFEPLTSVNKNDVTWVVESSEDEHLCIGLNVL